MSKTTVMIVAGERSGEVYGAELARALAERVPEVKIFGCGGEAMRCAGVETLVDAHEVTMVGVVEVVGGLPRARRALRLLGEAAERRRPRLAVLIDFPDFNLRLAKRLQRLDIPVVYFVSPQVWAWRRGRLRQLKETITKMLCIFDFEERIYSEAGIPVEYVGHPLVDLVRPQLSREEFFRAADLNSALPTVALLPGSRENEVALNLPPMLDAATRLTLARQLQFAVVRAPTLDPLWFERKLAECYIGRATLRVVSLPSFEVLTHADLAVLASGTATVEALLCQRPMIVVYRVSPLTWAIGKRLVKVPFYSMVNLLAGKALVPELIQNNFDAPSVAAQVEYFLDHPEARKRLAGELAALKARLGPPGAIGRAADAVVGVLKAQREARPGA
jgi:lipid-A-disaccharide synthase